MTNQTTLAVDQDLLEKVKYNEKSLVPGLVQDMHSGEILMRAMPHFGVVPDRNYG